MRRNIFLSLLVILLLGCTQGKKTNYESITSDSERLKKEEINNQRGLLTVNDLNGTWTQIFGDFSDDEINDVINEMNSDQAKQMKFNWGNGYFSANGSWYFDITSTDGFFFPDGGPKYIILSSTKDEIGRIVMEVIQYSTYDDFLKNRKNIDNARSAFYIDFVNKNKIRIITSDNKIFLRETPIVLYRVSGPN